MSSEMKRLLRPYAGRIHRRIWLGRFGIGVCAGVAAGLLLLLASFLTPIGRAPLLAAALAVSVSLVCGVVFAFLRPRPDRLAADIDRCGFQERVQTMLALEGDRSAFARLQREDTFHALGSADPKACVPVTMPRGLFSAAGAGLLLACVLALLPSPQDGILRAQAEIRQVMQEQAKRVEADLELLNRDNTLSEARKAELNEKLRELAKELRQGKDYKEGIKQISQLQKELEDLQKNQSRDQLSDLRSALERQDGTEELAERMADQTAEEAAEELRQAIMVAQEKDDEQSKDLARSLREATEGMGDGAVKDALEKLADALEEGDQAAIDEALQELEDALEGSGSGGVASQIGDSLKLVKSRMSQASRGEAFTGDPSQLMPDGQGGQDGQDAQDGQQGQGAQQGYAGSAGSQGQGAGQGGQGQSGQGQSGSGLGFGAGAGSGDLVESEKIYDSRRLDADGQHTRIQGEINADGPKQQAETGGGQGSLDGYVPYQQVVGEYAEGAVNAAKREQLPPAVQDWVEGYFSALQD